mmetsp:Transcript_2482/g.3655  ORF Transcript_2482/g.3655 Transcript_2482/m.3655 type:complete len:379 (-) Transcript_2482:250-1386(-)
MAKKKKNCNISQDPTYNKRQRSEDTRHTFSPPLSTVAQSPKNETKERIVAQTRKGGEKRPVSIVPYVIRWLEFRKKTVPKSLKCDDTRELATPDIDQVLRQLPNLRERERRALKRYAEKARDRDCVEVDSDAKKESDLEGSDGEYEISENDRLSTAPQVPNVRGGTWPSHVEFSNDYRWDESVPSEIKDKYVPRTIRRRAARPSRNVYVKSITDPDHPAYGEFGLYSAHNLPPGSWLLDYIGHNTLGGTQDKNSDYVSDFGEKSELACDANTFGNEARFINDFRNTGKHANVEFNVRRDARGELRQGVYVKLKKDVRGNDKNNKDFNGVKQDEELLVTYGKSYWRSRVGNLTDFVWRLPGQPATNRPQVETTSKDPCI